MSTPALPLTFIVGTGRCGSTLLSRILHGHPEVLSLNEFFTANRRLAFPQDPLDGPAFWRMLAAPSPILDGFVRNKVLLPELLYPYDSGRFGPDTGVPGISQMTLPLLSDDPDSLYDDLAAEVPAWPTRPVDEHYRDLFGLLADRLGRRVVVERSGMSLPLVGKLRRTFPEARFAHLYRNGPDSAVSMSRHPGFRLAMLLTGAARMVGLNSHEELTEEHVRLLPAPLAKVVANEYDEAFIMGADLKLPAFGQMWSSLVAMGIAELSQLPAGAWTTIGYASIQTEPAPALTRLAEFLGVQPTESWLRESAARIDPSRTGGAGRLDPATLAELRAACAPGEQALADAGADLPDEADPKVD